MTRNSVAFVALLGLLVTSAWPQASTSTIRGTVRDQSNAVLAGTSVTLRNTDTNIASKTTTNAAGSYVFPGVLPGSYLLLIEAPGMQSYEGALTVHVQQDAVVDAVLKVGQVTSEVSVQDVTPMLVVDNPTLGQVLERQRIEQLPINGRFVTDLLQTIPGLEGTRAFGEQRGSLEWVADGAVVSDRYQDNFRRPPGLDTIREFKVETNNSSAKFTRPTTVIMSTKSGTNNLHGALFETHRNNAIGKARTRTDFYTKPPHLVRNEFGASAGGPVFLPKLYDGRNRTFWFFAWEAYRNMSASTAGFRVATEAMRNGDFRGLVDAQGRQTRIYDPLTTNAQTWQRQPFSYGGQLNVIDPARMNPLAKYLLGITPLPTHPQINPLVDNNWWGPVPNTQRHYTVSTRIDHRFSDRDQFYARYSRSGFQNQVPNGGMPMLNGRANMYTFDSPNQDLALSYVHLFSPTLFNELLVSGRRDIRAVNTNDKTDWPGKLGLPNPLGALGWPFLTGAGLNGMQYLGNGSQGSALNYYIVDDGFTKVRGRHELQFGIHLRFDQLNVLPDVTGRLGVHNWNTLATALYDPNSSRSSPLSAAQTGNNAANLYLGVMNYSTRFSRGYYYTRGGEQALYFQDNFKVTSRLTVNLGLRWERWPALREKNNVMSGWDFGRRAVVLGADLDTLYRLGATLPSIVKRLESLGAKFESYKEAGLPQSLAYGNSKNFGPRLGFAYRLGEGKHSFVVRGGYRISYFAPLLQSWTSEMRYETPFEAQFGTMNDDAAHSPDGIRYYGLRSAPTIYAGVNSRNAVDLNDTSSITRGAEKLVFFDPHQPDSRVQDWNLTLEREVLPNTMARVAYVGNHSGRLQQTYFFNEDPPDYIWYATTGLSLPAGEFASVARRPYDQRVYGTYEQFLKTGFSNYNGMQFELQRRYHRGYGFQVFYNVNNTLAATGNIPATNQFMPGAVPEDLGQRNRFLNYARDASIPKHRVRWNWIADLPFGSGKLLGGKARGFLDKIIGGWQLAGMGSMRSTYFSLPTGIYPTGNEIELYGYKYPVQDCRGGTCWPGYLWWNGYIPANQINSVDANGRPNGVMGVPSNYKAAGQPLLPWPANPSRSDPMYQFYGTNTVWVTLKNGTQQRTALDEGLHPWREQYFPSVWQWGLDASLFKSIRVGEKVRVRFNADFFNVLNRPGNPNNVGADGILDVRNSGAAARELQLTLRVTW